MAVVAFEPDLRAFLFSDDNCNHFDIRWNIKWSGVLYAPQFTLPIANISLLRVWNEVFKIFFYPLTHVSVY